MTNRETPHPLGGCAIAILALALNFCLACPAGSAGTTKEPVQSRRTVLRLTSYGPQDGRIWEATRQSERGSRLDAADARGSAIRVGDLRGDLRYRSVLSFDTSVIPDEARVDAATLHLERGRAYGTDPFTTRECYVDVSRGGFGGDPELAVGDFEAPATISRAGRLSHAAADGDWSTAALEGAALSAIDKRGMTQFRIYFPHSDGDDGYDYVGFYSGDGAPRNRPRLVVVFETWQRSQYLLPLGAMMLGGESGHRGTRAGWRPIGHGFSSRFASDRPALGEATASPLFAPF